MTSRSLESIDAALAMSRPGRSASRQPRGVISTGMSIRERRSVSGDVGPSPRADSLDPAITGPRPQVTVPVAGRHDGDRDQPVLGLEQAGQPVPGRRNRYDGEPQWLEFCHLTRQARVIKTAWVFVEIDMS
jgi:hypothetical protein